MATFIFVRVLYSHSKNMSDELKYSSTAKNKCSLFSIKVWENRIGS